MSIMNLGLFATAQPLIALRTQGVLKRLGATPLPRSTLLAAYVALRVTTAGLQAALIVSSGVLLFDVAMSGSWLAFAGWVLLGTLTFIAIGFFVAATARTEKSGTIFDEPDQLPNAHLVGCLFSGRRPAGVRHAGCTGYPADLCRRCATPDDAQCTAH